VALVIEPVVAMSSLKAHLWDLSTIYLTEWLSQNFDQKSLELSKGEGLGRKDSLEGFE